MRLTFNTNLVITKEAAGWVCVQQGMALYIFYVRAKVPTQLNCHNEGTVTKPETERGMPIFSDSFLCCLSSTLA